MQTLVVFVQWQRSENFWNLQAFSDENHEIISFRKSSVCISITYGLKIIFISVFVFRYSIRFACFCLSCYLLLYIVVYSLCICLLRGASWYVVRWIVLYRLVLSRWLCCRLQSLVLSVVVPAREVVLPHCSEWPRHPRNSSGGPTCDPQEGGAIFQKGGRG